MADTTPRRAPLRPQARPTGDALGNAPGDMPERLRPALRPTDLGGTPADVARAATRPGALPLDRLALIGLFYTPEGASALIRLPGGALVRAVAGTLVGDGRVVAVLRDGVRLQRDGHEEVLTLPG